MRRRSNRSYRADTKGSMIDTVATTETELEMVTRHVREGERHVLRQREIVRDLLDRHHPTALAEQLLVEFEQTLVDHRAHLTRLTAGSARA
jgi:hypothetical protein